MFRDLHGWVVVAKGLVFLSLFVLPTWAGQLAVLARILGSVISHAPGRVRQWPLVGSPGPCAGPADTRTTEALDPS